MQHGNSTVLLMISDGQRTAIQIYDVVNTANEGTTITDPQYYIPRLTTKTTYYKVVDKIHQLMIQIAWLETLSQMAVVMDEFFYGR